MSPIFILFLLMLAAFVLLTLGAALRSAWHFFRPPTDAGPGGPSKVADGLLLIGVAAAWYSVAGGLAGQFIIYPNYADLAPFGTDVFQTFGRNYLSRLPIFLIPIATMCLAWVLLLWIRCRDVPRRIVWAIVGLCVGFVIVTPFSAFAQDRMLAEGFSESVYAQLMWSNGARSVIFTAIGLLSLAAARSRWTTPTNREPGA